MLNADVTKMAFMQAPAELLTVDLTDLQKRAKQVREARDKANPPKPEPERVEYNRLRKELYDVEQQAKGAETNCNNKADEVKGLEQRINDLLKAKKQAVADGHLGQERMLEHQIVLLETELLDARLEFQRAKNWSTQAGRALRAFNQRDRIAELRAYLNG